MCKGLALSSKDVLSHESSPHLKLSPMIIYIPFEFFCFPILYFAFNHSAHFNYNNS
jgi:hypothetical protein